MKKKSKILNKLITAMFAVLCVALLCVPAFASAPSDGELVEFLPECHPTFVGDNNDFIFVVENAPAFVVGEIYIVNWNGMEYTCVGQDVSAIMAGGVLVGNGEFVGLDSGGEPFLIVTMDGVMSCIAMNETTELTLSIYQVVDPSSSLFANISTLVDSSVGWVGQFVTAVTAQPLLLCFCIVIFVGVGIGLISRIKR